MANIVIPKEAFPTGRFEVELREPLFKDRLNARRRHPGDSANCGYTVQDLMTAMCLEKVNGQPLPGGPTDIIDRIRQMPLADSQFLITTFISAFVLDEELAQKAKEIADGFRTQTVANYTIRAEDMPSGLFSVTFTEPVMEDSMRLEMAYPGEDSKCGYTFEEMVFADSIIAIDGQAVKKTRDPIEVIQDWPHLDANFASAVVLKIAYIDRNKGKDAERLGKSLRTGLYKKDVGNGTAVTSRVSSAKSSSKPATTTDSAQA